MPKNIFQYQSRLPVRVADVDLSGLTTSGLIPIPIDTYAHLRLEAFWRWGAGSVEDPVTMQLSTGGVLDTGANYDVQHKISTAGATFTITNATGLTGIPLGRAAIALSSANYFCSMRAMIWTPNGSAWKHVWIQSISESLGEIRQIRGLWRNTGKIDQLQFTGIGNAFAANSVFRIFGDR